MLLPNVEVGLQRMKLVFQGESRLCLSGGIDKKCTWQMARCVVWWIRRSSISSMDGVL